jgi:hypothetical protein
MDNDTIRLSNDDAIKAQVLFWLRRQEEAKHLDNPVYLYVRNDADGSGIAQLVTSLEGIIATANAALHMIDQMREPVLDLEECRKRG